jgi:hypothetical protein
VRTFGVETAEQDGGTRVALTGDLDLSTAKRAEEALEELAAGRRG